YHDAAIGEGTSLLPETRVRPGGDKPQTRLDAADCRSHRCSRCSSQSGRCSGRGGRITSQLAGEEMQADLPGLKGGDRTSLELPKEEEDVLEALGATGKPLVVVLMNGSALAVNWAEQHANAILDAWYSGEEGGTAIAQTLSGVNNPAGRLPVTF